MAGSRHGELVGGLWLLLCIIVMKVCLMAVREESYHSLLKKMSTVSYNCNDLELL